MNDRFDFRIVHGIVDMFSERLHMLEVEQKRGITTDIPGQKERYEEFMKKCWADTKQMERKFLDEVERMNALVDTLAARPHNTLIPK